MVSRCGVLWSVCLVLVLLGSSPGLAGDREGGWLGGGNPEVPEPGKPPPSRVPELPRPPPPPPPIDHRIWDPQAHQGRAVGFVYLDAAAREYLLEHQEPEVRRVTVGAQDREVHPGIRVPPGATVRVQPVRGAWSVDQRNYPPVGPQGHLDLSELYTRWGHLRDEVSLPFGRLLGWVRGGAFFDAGDGAAVRFEVGGGLHLKINDKVGAYGDNGGAVTVDVEVYPPPQGRPSTPPSSPSKLGSTGASWGRRN